MSTEIRRAQEKDTSFIAWVQLAAARSHVPIGFFDLAFPGEEEQRLSLIERVCATKTLSMCHWSGFFVADVDGEPVAGLSGYEPTTRGHETFAAAMSEGLRGAGWTPEEVDGAFGRMGPFLKCAPDSPDDAWIVEWVATTDGFRGRGLIRSLLERVLEEGKQKSYRRSQISLLIDNHPAQRAYESAGFKVEDEKRHPEFEATFGSPGIRRMLRDL
ncbi:MAG: GNAT family N-acetyltransferase [Candidatus Binatia bacterium]|nr:GNAT family N-acetyltransferase [Candidatus Binatia bacterium]